MYTELLEGDKEIRTQAKKDIVNLVERKLGQYGEFKGKARHLFFDAPVIKTLADWLDNFIAATDDELARKYIELFNVTLGHYQVIQNKSRWSLSDWIITNMIPALFSIDDINVPPPSKGEGVNESLVTLYMSSFMTRERPKEENKDREDDEAGLITHPHANIIAGLILSILSDTPSDLCNFALTSKIYRDWIGEWYAQTPTKIPDSKRSLVYKPQTLSDGKPSYKNIFDFLKMMSFLSDKFSGEALHAGDFLNTLSLRNSPMIVMENTNEDEYNYNIKNNQVYFDHRSIELPYSFYDSLWPIGFEDHYRRGTHGSKEWREDFEKVALKDKGGNAQYDSNARFLGAFPLDLLAEISPMMSLSQVTHFFEQVIQRIMLTWDSREREPGWEFMQNQRWTKAQASHLLKHILQFNATYWLKHEGKGGGPHIEALFDVIAYLGKVDNDALEALFNYTSNHDFRPTHHSSFYSAFYVLPINYISKLSIAQEALIAKWFLSEFEKHNYPELSRFMARVSTCNLRRLLKDFFNSNQDLGLIKESDFNYYEVLVKEWSKRAMSQATVDKLDTKSMIPSGSLAQLIRQVKEKNDPSAWACLTTLVVPLLHPHEAPIDELIRLFVDELNSNQPRLEKTKLLEALGELALKLEGISMPLFEIFKKFAVDTLDDTDTALAAYKQIYLLLAKGVFQLIDPKEYEAYLIETKNPDKKVGLFKRKVAYTLLEMNLDLSHFSQEFQDHLEGMKGEKDQSPLYIAKQFLSDYNESRKYYGYGLQHYILKVSTSNLKQLFMDFFDRLNPTHLEENDLEILKVLVRQWSERETSQAAVDELEPQSMIPNHFIEEWINQVEDSAESRALNCLITCVVPLLHPGDEACVNKLIELFLIELGNKQHSGLYNKAMLLESLGELALKSSGEFEPLFKMFEQFATERRVLHNSAALAYQQIYRLLAKKPGNPNRRKQYEDFFIEKTTEETYFKTEVAPGILKMNLDLSHFSEGFQNHIEQMRESGRQAEKFMALGTLCLLSGGEVNDEVVLGLLSIIEKPYHEEKIPSIKLLHYLSPNLHPQQLGFFASHSDNNISKILYDSLSEVHETANQENPSIHEDSIRIG